MARSLEGTWRPEHLFALRQAVALLDFYQQQIVACDRESEGCLGGFADKHRLMVGYHGHAAGPPIGMTDYQEGVPVRGDLAVRPSTWFSIELQATSPVPEWNGRRLACRQEEDASLDEAGERHWVFRRQERFHLVQ